MLLNNNLPIWLQSNCGFKIYHYFIMIILACIINQTSTYYILSIKIYYINWEMKLNITNNYSQMKTKFIKIKQFIDSLAVQNFTKCQKLIQRIDDYYNQSARKTLTFVNNVQKLRKQTKEHKKQLQLKQKSIEQLTANMKKIQQINEMLKKSKGLQLNEDQEVINQKLNLITLLEKGQYHQAKRSDSSKKLKKAISDLIQYNSLKSTLKKYFDDSQQSQSNGWGWSKAYKKIKDTIISQKQSQSKLQTQLQTYLQFLLQNHNFILNIKPEAFNEKIFELMKQIGENLSAKQQNEARINYLQQNLNQRHTVKQQGNNSKQIVKQILSLFNIQKSNIQLKNIQIWLKLIKDKIIHTQNQSQQIQRNSQIKNLLLNEANLKQKLLFLNELIVSIQDSNKDIKSIKLADDLNIFFDTIEQNLQLINMLAKQKQQKYTAIKQQVSKENTTLQIPLKIKRNKTLIKQRNQKQIQIQNHNLQIIISTKENNILQLNQQLNNQRLANKQKQLIIKTSQQENAELKKQIGLLTGKIKKLQETIRKQMVKIDLISKSNQISIDESLRYSTSDYLQIPDLNYKAFKEQQQKYKQKIALLQNNLEKMEKMVQKSQKNANHYKQLLENEQLISQQKLQEIQFLQKDGKNDEQYKQLLKKLRKSELQSKQLINKQKVQLSELKTHLNNKMMKISELSKQKSQLQKELIEEKKTKNFKKNQSVYESINQSISFYNPQEFISQYNMNYFFLQGNIFSSEKQQLRNLLRQNLQDYKGAILRTKLIYKDDIYNKANIHRYIDNLNNIVVIVKTIYGQIIAAYTQSAFSSEQILLGRGFLINLKNKKNYKIISNKKPIIYDKKNIIFGNNELKLDRSQHILYCNLGMTGHCYDINKQKGATLLSDNMDNGQQIDSYEIYHIKFSNDEQCF